MLVNEGISTAHTQHNEPTGDLRAQRREEIRTCLRITLKKLGGDTSPANVEKVLAHFEEAFGCEQIYGPQAEEG